MVGSKSSIATRKEIKVLKNPLAAAAAAGSAGTVRR
jgi:hypothetical protein